ncbi:MAG: hypothetical protein AAGE43_02485 [Pseudomonadota bacterium]
MDADIEAVETAYEFLLAYAAQGREDDADGPLRRARDVLKELDDALNGIKNNLDGSEPFHQVLREDIEKTLLALALVLKQPRISSELVDNLNASMHLRAVLTDLFLLSEAARIQSSP